MKFKTVIQFISISAFALVFNPAPADSNIDPAKSYAWGENIGWVNLYPSAEFGVTVSDTYLSGYAWSENAGWINFGSIPSNGTAYTNTGTNHGVNVEVGGGLTGYAWGENIGWISFDTSGVGGSQVMIDTVTGEFSGYAWSENVGWINFGDGYSQGLRYLDDTSEKDWYLFQ